MSNIQITENGPGKYSPEWFYSESQTQNGFHLLTRLMSYEKIL